jgi:signal transduction histidine kinase/ligand-binding sensor domain-containing protein
MYGVGTASAMGIPVMGTGAMGMLATDMAPTDTDATDTNATNTNATDTDDPFVLRRWGVESGLPQSSVTDLVMDDTGFLWGGTYGGLFRFDGLRIVPQRGILGQPIGSTFNSLVASASGGVWAADLDGNVVRVESGRVVERLPPIGPGAPARSQTKLYKGEDGRLWAWVGTPIFAWREEAPGDRAPGAPTPGTTNPGTTNPGATNPGATNPGATTPGEWIRVGEANRTWPGGTLVPTVNQSMFGGTAPDESIGFQGVPFLVSVEAGVRLGPPPGLDLRQGFGAAARDRQGRLWIATPREIVIIHENQRIGSIPAPGQVDALAAGPDGSMWVLGGHGVCRIFGPGLTEPGAAETAALDPGTAAREGVDPATLDPGRLQREHQPWSAQTSVVLSAVVSPDNVLFAGLLGEGLVAITPRVGRTLDVRQQFYSNNARPDTVNKEIHSVLLDRAGGLWISKDCGSTIRLAGVDADGLRTRTTVVPGCTSSMVLDTVSGAVWVGTNTGVVRAMANGTVERFDFLEDLLGLAVLLNPFVSALAMDGGDLIMGFSDGQLLRRLADGTIVRLADWEPAEQGRITAIAREAGGTFLVAQRGFVRRVDARGATVSASPLEIEKDGEIRTILQEPDGGLWFGSYGGGIIYRAPDGTRRQLPVSDPSVSSLLFDRDGNLWAFKNKGATRFGRTYLEGVRQGLDLPPDRRILTPADGVFEVSSGRPASALLPDGRMLVATIEGLVLLDPTRLTVSAPRVSPRIELIRTPLREIRAPEGILELEPRERVAEIQLSVPVYRSSDQLFVRYRVVRGRTAENWFTPLQPGLIQLVGLAPGRFQLQIEVAISGSDWVPMDPLPIHAIPTFWERRAVQGALVLLSLLMLILVLRIRAQAELERSEAQTERERLEERQRHLDELSLLGRHALAGELSASLAHELGQPVTAILHTATALKGELDEGALDPDAIRETADELVTQANRARGILTGLRRFLRTGAPEREPLDVLQLIEAILQIAAPDLEQDRIRLDADLPQSPIPTLVAEGVLIQQALLILISNAADAVRRLPPRRRTLTLRVSVIGTPGRPGAGIRFTVADRGIGIPKGQMGQIFDTFYSVKKDGMGMGLPIARRIILSHGGRIALRSRELRGTVATFWLPLTPP